MGRPGRRTLSPLAKAGVLEFIQRENLMPGDRLESEKELSDQVGVSRPVIRQALEDLAKAGRIVTRPGVGHFVADPKTHIRDGIVTAMLGFLSRSSPYKDPYLVEILHGFERVFGDSPYRLVSEVAGPYVHSIEKRRKPHFTNLGGALLVPLGEQHGRDMLASLPAGLPHVLVGRRSEGVCSSAWVDQVKAIQKGIQYLLSLGHRKFGVIGTVGHSWAVDLRLEAVRTELAAASVSLAPEDIIRCENNFQGEHGLTQGEQAVSHFLRRNPDVTALFVLGATVLPGTLRALAANNVKIPQDISLVAFDDSSLAQQHAPMLTVIRQPLEEMGRIGAHILFEKLVDRESELQEVVLSAELIVRESCAPPMQKVKV